MLAGVILGATRFFNNKAKRLIGIYGASERLHGLVVLWVAVFWLVMTNLLQYAHPQDPVDGPITVVWCQHQALCNGVLGE